MKNLQASQQIINKNKYIGLDVGTNSVGWCVTDKNYVPVKLNGKTAMGVRLFDASETCAKCRQNRSARRNVDRLGFRLECLQMLFADEINKVDPTFLQKIKETNLYKEDKTYVNKYSFFNDDNFSDVDFHNKYPTMFHLRKELIHDTNKHDIRLVYLALQHLIKHRGHFMYDLDVSNADVLNDIAYLWNDFNQFLLDKYGIQFKTIETLKIEKILKDKTLNRTKRKEALINLFNLNKKEDKMLCAILTVLVGNSAKPATLFNNDDYKESETQKIIVSKSYEDNAPIYETEFEDDFELVEKIKGLFDWVILSEILKKYEYVCDAKVDDYYKHKSDLKLLKEYVKTYCPEQYKTIFRNDVKGNYVSYSKNNFKGKSCEQPEFCAFLRKTLPENVVNEKYQEMYFDIENDTFMPKTITKLNSVIPVQLIEKEALAILDNAKQYYSFLSSVDEDGISVYDKIHKTLMFKVPYYVGPLNQNSNKAWLVRTNEKIYPWNFNKVVDLEKTSQNFILNLIGHCSQLPAYYVLPKCSLLYSSYMVLSELNKIKINYEPISVELKQNIYNDLFSKTNAVTEKALRKYISKKIGVEEFTLTGMSKQFKNSLKSYRDLASYNLTKTEKEQVIEDITIFKQDKNVLKTKLKRELGHKLSDSDIAKICSLNYKGWGRFSKELLLNIKGFVPELGAVTNIITAMWETNQNFMELTAARGNDFEKVIQQYNSHEYKSLEDELRTLYISPNNYRAIYQTVKIVDELIKVGGTPEKIFIEVARGDEAKIQTKSRKTKLLELYKSCKGKYKELYDEIKKLDDVDLRKDNLYLYYSQFGRSMYTGKPIKQVNGTFPDCDIDHIFPRSKVKDDSLNNKVLVEKVINNQNKKADYPLDKGIQADMFGFWKELLDKKAITQSKFDRLIRTTELNNRDLETFAQRQLVDTRQSTKAIGKLFERYYPDTEIVYVKANLVSDYRNDKNFVKCREINDFHHAKDAYLNIVVGNVYNTRYNYNRSSFVKGLKTGKYSLNHMFDYDVKGAWDSKTSQEIVNKVMQSNNILFTRYAKKQKGELFDLNPLKKSNDKLFPLKKDGPLSDVNKYGGYQKAKSGFFVLFKYLDKNNIENIYLYPVNLVDIERFEENPTLFLEQTMQIKQVQIIQNYIKYGTLFDIDGFKCHLSGKTGSRLILKNAQQLILTQEQKLYIKHMTSYLNKCKKIKKEKPLTKDDEISTEGNNKLFNVLLNKIENTAYKTKYNTVLKNLKEHQQDFENLSMMNQCYILNEILVMLHNDVRSGDFSKLGLGSKCGVLNISQNLTNQNIKIINQSVTGLFQNEINLTA